MRSFFILSAVLLVLASSCYADADLAKGKEVYDKTCSSCHGATGAGDGPTSAALPPAMKPASFLDGKFKKVQSDDDLKKLLKEGGPAFG